MTAYVAASAASAPPPRGLPLSVTAPARNSVSSGVPRVPSAFAPATTASAAPAADAGSGEGGDWEDGVAPADYFSGDSSSDTGVPPDDSGPPIEELESRMAGEVAAQQAAAASAARKRPAAREGAEDDDASAKTPLPDLDALIERLAPEVRETLDELFRVRFVSVKKVPKAAFAAATTRKADV